MTESDRKSEHADVSIREVRVRHEDDTWVDHVELNTVERWKESELSGDEWRFSYETVFYRKGIVVGRRSFGWPATAAAWIGYVASLGWGCSEHGAVSDEVQSALALLCDQPGCAMPGTERRTLIHRYDKSSGTKLPETPWTVHYRLFCLQHRHRGDCGFEDADCNYEETAREA